uniref:Uncharacterized protein n=1 Tax=Marseillevirus LCMAC101 TaxID=2506602 RepID=A0A481YR51_9VIRU|nr:MAG: hypothetical protein LCMAC101_00470 [Marseillevirus LCMAC101]
MRNFNNLSIIFVEIFLLRLIYVPIFKENRYENIYLVREMENSISWTYDYGSTPYKDDVKFALSINHEEPIYVDSSPYDDYTGIIFSVEVEAYYGSNTNVYSKKNSFLTPAITDPLPNTCIIGTCAEKGDNPILSFDITFGGFTYRDWAGNKTRLYVQIQNLEHGAPFGDYMYEIPPEDILGDDRESGLYGTFTMNTTPPWTTPGFKIYLHNFEQNQWAFVNLLKGCTECNCYCPDHDQSGNLQTCTSDNECVVVVSKS